MSAFAHDPNQYIPQAWPDPPQPQLHKPAQDLTNITGCDDGICHYLIHSTQNPQAVNTNCAMDKLLEKKQNRIKSREGRWLSAITQLGVHVI